MAPLISDGPIIILVLFILVQTPTWFLTSLEVVGGFLLIYLAYGSFRAFQRKNEVSAALPTAARTGVLKAALINASSPLPYIWWATVAGPLFLAGWRETPLYGTTFLLGFYGTLIAGFAALILVFASANRIDRRISRVLLAISVVGLLAFGLLQLYRGLTGLLG